MAYCTPTDLQELGYTWESTESAYIQGICDTASYAIDAYCRQTFVATTGFVESGVVRVRCGVVRYFPKNLTISKVNSMTFNSVNGQAVQFTIDNYEYETDRGYIIGWTNAFDGLYRCTVSYDFGFATYPSDLVKATVLACAPLLDDYFLAQESNVNMVKSIRQGELRIERADTHTVPQNTIDILHGGNYGLGYVRWRATS